MRKKVYMLFPKTPHYIMDLQTLYSGSSAEVNIQWYKENKTSFYSKGNYTF